MLAGIALLGVVTASIASWLIEWVEAAETQTQAAEAADSLSLRRQLESLTAEVAELRRALTAPQESADGGQPALGTLLPHLDSNQKPFD